MSERFAKPSVEAIRASLERCRPELAKGPITYFDEGWDFWAFKAGDYLLRFPQAEYGLGSMEKEWRLLPALAPTLPVAIPVPDLFCADGPNGKPFIGHRFLAGISVGQLGRPPAPGFGAALGRFLRALHDFPLEQAVSLGVPLFDGPKARSDRIETYERTVRQVFPRLGREARTYVEKRVEAYLNDPANFEFEPRLHHHDLDRDAHVLVDTQTGALVGVIDFGDAVVGNPSVDFMMPLMEFESLGIADQIEDVFAAYGPTGQSREQMRAEVEFLYLRWPLNTIEFGLDTADDARIEKGIRDLNAQVARHTLC